MRNDTPKGEADVIDLNEISEEFKEVEGVFQNISKEDFGSHYDLGVTYMEMDLIDAAIHEFEIASAGKKQRLNALKMMASCYEKKGDVEKAKRIYVGELIHIIKEALSRAEPLYNSKASGSKDNPYDEKELLEEFKPIVFQDISKDFESHYDLGLTYMEMDLIDAAIHEFEIASAGKKQRLNALKMMASCYEKKGDVEKAEKIYKKLAIKREPKEY